MGAVTSVAAEKALNGLVGSPTIEARLFTNDYTPTVSDALDCSDYTEASFGSYTQINLGDYGTNNVGDGEAWVDHDEITWTPSSGSGMAYGVYFTDAVSGELIGACRFTTPKTISTGVPIRANPRFRARDASL